MRGARTGVNRAQLQAQQTQLQVFQEEMLHLLASSQ